jgi:hypothetical protein
MSHHGKNHNNGIPAGNLPNAHAVANPAEASDPTGRNVQLETQVNNPVGPGPSHRGDRRDTHPSFATGKGGRGSTAGKARNGGRSGPLGASGRKSGPKAN